MCQDDFQRIMDELDEEDGDDFFDALTDDELELAANIEAQLKMEMAARAISEQTFLGAGDALPLCTPKTDPAEELASAGVVRLGGVLSDSTAAELREFVLQELERGFVSGIFTQNRLTQSRRRLWPVRLIIGKRGFQLNNDIRHVIFSQVFVGELISLRPQFKLGPNE